MNSAMAILKKVAIGSLAPLQAKLEEADITLRGKDCFVKDDPLCIGVYAEDGRSGSVTTYYINCKDDLVYSFEDDSPEQCGGLHVHGIWDRDTKEFVELQTFANYWDYFRVGKEIYFIEVDSDLEPEVCLRSATGEHTITLFPRMKGLTTLPLDMSNTPELKVAVEEAAAECMGYISTPEYQILMYIDKDNYVIVKELMTSETLYKELCDWR